jgi:hypothetical protein
MKNTYYECYVEYCKELEKLMNSYNEDVKGAKKLRGAIAAELLKKGINKYFGENSKPYKASNINSYIAGSKFEYDILIVKESAEPFMEIVYQPEGVIAVIECKAGGLFNVEKDTDNIAQAVNRAQDLNIDIIFGYITISENVPVSDSKADGSATYKHWDKTIEYLDKKIKGNHVEYAVTLHKGNKLCDEGSDEEFYKFINYLIDEEDITNK